MIIKLTKDHKKPNGKVIKKGTEITVLAGHPYKDFEVIQPQGTLDERVNKIIDNTKKKDK